MPTPPLEKWVAVGRITGVYGVRGGVKIESYTEPSARIFEYRPWRIEASGGERDVIARRGPGGPRRLTAELPGIEDRDAAAVLVGSGIRIRRDVLPSPGDGFYWTDLEGLEVRLADGAGIGRVTHLVATGANDVLVVNDGTRERLVPFVPGTWVRKVDFDAGIIEVDWPSDF